MAAKSNHGNDLDNLCREYFEGDAEKMRILEDVRVNDEIGRKAYDLRTKAGLTQARLAKLAGTTTAMIRNLEDGDFEGNALAMLQRVAAALNLRVEIRAVPLRRSA